MVDFTSDALVNTAGGTLVPSNLRAGDIVRVKRRYIHDDGRITYPFRNCVVLGVEHGPLPDDNKKMTPTGLVLARLSYNRDKLDPTTDIIVDNDRLSIDGQGGRTLLLRADKIGTFPLNTQTAGTVLQRVGRVNDPVLLDDVYDRCQAANAALDNEPDGPRLLNKGAPITVSLDLHSGPVRAGDEFFRRYLEGDIDPYVLALRQRDEQAIQDRIDAHAAFIQAGGVVRQETGPIILPIAQPEPIAPVQPRISRKAMKRAARQESALAHVANDVIVPTAAPVVVERASPAGKTGPETRLVRSIGDPNAYIPKLPDNLKRGDIIIVNIVDILNPKARAQAQRPCVVWDVFTNADGDISGLEMLPCTRNRAYDFTHKFEIPSPFRSDQQGGTHVILEQMIRVPVTGEYFDMHVKRARALNPEHLRLALEGRARLEAEGGERKPFGLATRPPEWILREDITHAFRPVSYAEGRCMDTIDEQHEAFDEADTVIRPGMVINRNGSENKPGHPVLIWGVWRHRDTNKIVAVDTMRIFTGSEKGTPTSIHIKDENQAAAMGIPVGSFIDAGRVDLVPFTLPFFKRETVLNKTGMVPDELFDRLVQQRGQVLKSAPRRKASFPDMLPHSWHRTQGVSHRFDAASLRSKVFAPDIRDHQEPGPLNVMFRAAHNGNHVPNGRRAYKPRTERQKPVAKAE